MCFVFRDLPVLSVKPPKTRVVFLYVIHFSSYATNVIKVQLCIRWWFQIFLCSPLFGEMIKFDKYFSNGWKPPTSFDF